MSHFKLTGFALLSSLAIAFSLIAEEIPETNVDEVQDASEMPQTASSAISAEEKAVKVDPNAPRVKALFYSADAVQAIPRLKALAKQEPQYNKILFKLENFPKNQEIIFENRRLAGIDPKAYEHKVSFIIKDDGSMFIKGTDQRIQTIISSSHGFLPGERVVYRFRTADGAISKEVSGIPSPAVIKDKDYRTILKADLVSISPTVYRISLPTMNEGETYDLKSTSFGETVKAKPRYTKKKPFHFSPGSNSKSKGGEAILEIRRKSGKVYTIVLPWGSSLQGYLVGKKVYSPTP